MTHQTHIYTFGMMPEYEYPHALNYDRFTYALRCIHMAVGSQNLLLIPPFPGREQYLQEQKEIFDEFELEMPKIVLIEGGSYVFDLDIYHNLDKVIKALQSNKQVHVTSFARTYAQDLWVDALRK